MHRHERCSPIGTRGAARAPAPARAEIDPVAIRHALGDTFILAADFAGELRFRLAGTRICALFCRELKGEAFGALWGEASRESIEHLHHRGEQREYRRGGRR